MLRRFENILYQVKNILRRFENMFRRFEHILYQVKNMLDEMENIL